MASPSVSSPSEGEIVESDTDKATTSLVEPQSNSVDRQSRKRSTASRSPAPTKSPRRRLSRSSSRSPYQEPRGSKRPLEDDHYSRSRKDPRRFKIQYEDRGPPGSPRQRRSHRDLDASGSNASQYSHRDADGRFYEDRRRKRSRSPHESIDRNQHTHRSRNQGGQTGYSSQRSGERKFIEEAGRSFKNPSVDGFGRSADEASKQLLETDPGKHTSRGDETDSSKRMNSIREAQEAAKLSTEAPIDEAALIEERRKRREAIKARFKDQSVPAVLQTAINGISSGQTSPKPASEHVPGSAVEEDEAKRRVQTLDADTISPQQSLPNTPKENPGQDTPIDFVITQDSDLVNSNTLANSSVQCDEPSAADYDPTMDMQEDKLRQDQDQNRDGPPAITHKLNPSTDNSRSPNHVKDEPKKKARDLGEIDMFGDDEELDMFAEPQGAPLKHENETLKNGVPSQAKGLDMSMLDDWDDPDGYYKVKLGELLDNRYHVQSNLGKGMFSGVVRATDQKYKRFVAIKIIRNNETMKKAGFQEIEILQKLSLADPEDKKHVVRLERIFEHKSHLCMVFENLSIDLREVLKKFGRDVGINLKAVREYARQMFLGLSLLRKCNILHADLKPDNILVNDSRTMLKICDLGSASDATESEITRYLVSRFYRAPEIILGLPYDFAIDMWSIGCTLFELYTGKILFTGRSNNQMLRSIMDCRGKFSQKLLRKAEFAGLYFDESLNFRSLEKDRLTGKDVVRMLNFNKPTRDLKTRLMANVKGVSDAELKELNLFVDLLDRCLNIHAEKRCTPTEALKHPFIMRSKG